MIKLPSKDKSMNYRRHQPGAVFLHGCFFNRHPVHERLEKPDFQVVIGVGVEVVRHGMEDCNYVRGLEPSITVDKFKLTAPVVHACQRQIDDVHSPIVLLMNEIMRDDCQPHERQ